MPGAWVAFQSLLGLIPTCPPAAISHLAVSSRPCHTCPGTLSGLKPPRARFSLLEASHAPGRASQPYRTLWAQCPVCAWRTVGVSH